ncbi:MULTISPECIES: hypothetical protein [unclassified Marinovum]
MTVGFAALEYSLAFGLALGLAAYIWWLHRDADAGPSALVPSLALWGFEGGTAAKHRRSGLWWLVRTALVLVLLAAVMNLDMSKIGGPTPQANSAEAPGPEVLRASARRSLTAEPGLSVLITVSPEAGAAGHELVIRDGALVLGQMRLPEASLAPLRLDIPMPGGPALTINLVGPSGAVSRLELPVTALIATPKVVVAQSCGAGMARALRASAWYQPVPAGADLAIDCAAVPRPGADLRIWTGGQTPVQGGWSWHAPLGQGQTVPELPGIALVAGTDTGNDGAALKTVPIWRAGTQILARGQPGAVDVFVDLSRPEAQADARFAMLLAPLIDLAAGAPPSRIVTAGHTPRPAGTVAVPDGADPRIWLIGLALVLLLADGLRGLRRGD